ncbi:MAG: bleomycin resistance protein [Candidatus Acidiferrales bacterium]
MGSLTFGDLSTPVDGSAPRNGKFLPAMNLCELCGKSLRFLRYFTKSAVAERRKVVRSRTYFYITSAACSANAVENSPWVNLNSIVSAKEAGHQSWAELKAATASVKKTPRGKPGPPLLKNIIPILPARDVTKSAAFFPDKLGFRIDFLHGLPPFYGAVSRDGVRLHLRFVHEPFFAQAAALEESVIVASVEVANVQGLFEEFKARGVDFAQKLKKQAWGGTDFQVRDPDGNVISFVTYDKL